MAISSETKKQTPSSFKRRSNPRYHSCFAEHNSAHSLRSDNGPAPAPSPAGQIFLPLALGAHALPASSKTFRLTARTGRRLSCLRENGFSTAPKSSRLSDEFRRFCRTGRKKGEIFYILPQTARNVKRFRKKSRLLFACGCATLGTDVGTRKDGLRTGGRSLLVGRRASDRLSRAPLSRPGEKRRVLRLVSGVGRVRAVQTEGSIL